MTRYEKVKYIDIANGPGMRVSVFFQGCPHKCKGCFSSVTWDKDGGGEYTHYTEGLIKKALTKQEINGISILGGEPLADYNLEATMRLARYTQGLGKTVYIWTGWTFEELTEEQREVLHYTDALIAGPFVQELLSKPGKLYGSINQKVLRKDVDF